MARSGAPARPARRRRALAAACCCWLVLACASSEARTAPLPGATAATQAPPAPVRAEVHHEIEVALAPGEGRLAVTDTVTLSPELRARLGDAVAFTLHAGLAPERVGPGGPLAPAAAGAGAPGDDGDDPPVPLERFAVPLRPGERTFTVRYAGRIFHPIERGEEYARSMSTSPGLVSAEGAVLSGDTRWLPQLSEGLATFTLDARVPAGWEVVSQGERALHEPGAGETLVRWESAEPQDEVFLVAGPFHERSRRSGHLLVQTFLRGDDPALADGYLAAGLQYLSMYEALLGPYPYPKLAVVENFWETGYGMPSFTLLGSRVVRFPFILHSSYPHEILHNWWGNGVLVAPGGGNWSEGLTAYLADHLVQEQRGQGAEYRRASLQRYADYVAVAADFPVREFRARHGSVTQAVGYDKVLMVFHMLRQKLGDERFVAGLRRLYAEERFRAASFADLARDMGAAAGEELAPWLAQWVDRPGAPALRLESARTTRRDGAVALELVLAQVQDGPSYELDVPVEVTLRSSAAAVRRSVRLTERRQRFTLELDGAPVRVDVDPEYDLFRRLDPAELPPTLGGAFGASEVVIVLPSSAPPARRAAYAAVAEAWRRPGTQVVTDAELARLPAGKAVWILGWENRLRGAVASGVEAYGATLSGDGLRTRGAALARDRHAVVVAVRSPADPARVAAFVGAADAAALPGLARKLPHYGKYSVLGFEGAEPANVAKDTWPVLDSPLAAAIGAGGGLPPRAAPPPRRALAELPPPPGAPAPARGR